MRYKLLTWETDVEWQYDAACLGVVARTGEDPFFHNDEVPSGKHPSRVRKAKTFCARCKVKQQCLNFALENDCLGVWGGTTDRERKKMK
jgi:WhiB family transcriptional regulator, redox-sensing transcriptional regulator